MRKIALSLVLGVALTGTMVAGAFADDAKCPDDSHSPGPGQFINTTATTAQPTYTAPAYQPAPQARSPRYDTPVSNTPAYSGGHDSDFIVKIGVLEPSGTEISTSNQLFGGLEYEWYPHALAGQGGSAWSITADYVQTQQFATFGNVNLTSYPVMLNYKWFTSGNTPGFIGVGVGGWLGNFGGFGYQGMVGIEATRNINIELRYIGNSGGSVTNPDAAFSNFVPPSTLNSVFGLDVGFKFK